MKENICYVSNKKWPSDNCPTSIASKSEYIDTVVSNFIISQFSQQYAAFTMDRNTFVKLVVFHTIVFSVVHYRKLFPLHESRKN